MNPDNNIQPTSPTTVDNPNLHVAHRVTSVITIIFVTVFGIFFISAMIFGFAFAMALGGEATPLSWLLFIALLLVPIALFWLTIRYFIKSRRNLATTGTPEKLSKQLIFINILIALWLVTSIYRSFGYRASEAPLPPNISIGLFLCSLVMMGLTLSSLRTQKTQHSLRGLYARPIYSVVLMGIILMVAVSIGSLSVRRLIYRDPDTNQPLFYVPYTLSETVKEGRVGFTDSFDESGEGILGPTLTRYEFRDIWVREQGYFSARIIKRGDKGYVEEGDPGFYSTPEELEQELKRRHAVQQETALKPTPYVSDHQVAQVGNHTLHTYRKHYIAVIFKPDYMVLIRYYYDTLNPTIEKLTFVD